MSIQAVLSNEAVLGVLNPGTHGSTFGGNPLACAIARAALRVLVEEELFEDAASMGTYFLKGLKQISNPCLSEVGGKGLMIGLEFYPQAGGARQYSEELKKMGCCAKKHMIISFDSPHHG